MFFGRLTSTQRLTSTYTNAYLKIRASFADGIRCESIQAGEAAHIPGGRNGHEAHPVYDEEAWAEVRRQVCVGGEPPMRLCGMDGIVG